MLTTIQNTQATTQNQEATQTPGIAKFTLYVGLNDKDSKRQEIATEEAIKTASELVANQLGGGTIYSARGIYQHEDGTIITENTLRIEILFADAPDVLKLVADLKQKFNQESVAVQFETIYSELI